MVVAARARTNSRCLRNHFSPIRQRHRKGHENRCAYSSILGHRVPKSLETAVSMIFKPFSTEGWKAENEVNGSKFSPRSNIQSVNAGLKGAAPKSQAKPLFALLLSIIVLSYVVFAETPGNESTNTTMKQITKLVDFVFDAFGLSARLVLANDTPIGNREIQFYGNGSYIGTGITDLNGYSSTNYSPLFGTYDISASFGGTETLMPTNISQAITVENAANATAENEEGIIFDNLHFNTTRALQNESVLFNVSIISTSPVQAIITGIYPTGEKINRTLEYDGDSYFYVWADTQLIGTYRISDIYATAENASNHTQVNLTFEIIQIPEAADMCQNITCGQKCGGTTLFKDGQCASGTCQYTQIENSTECGYVAPVVMKIIDLVLSSLSIIKGEIFTISARLSYENNTSIPDKALDFYEDSGYLGSNITDENGIAILSVNTSEHTDGNHTVNVTYGGFWSTANLQITSGKNATISELDAVQGSAEVGKPVNWTKKIIAKNNKNAAEQLVVNVTLDSGITGLQIKDSDSGEEYSSNVKAVKGVKASIKTNEEHEFEDTLKPFEEKKYELTYQTPAPGKKETPAEKNNKEWKKNITVYSDYSYKNVLSYTNINEADISQIHLFWKVNGSLVDVTADSAINPAYIDTDGNGKIDRIYWIVPHLSEQEFVVVVDLTVINVQSYPTVGGNWTVMFNTTGTANLTITAINGTTFGNSLPDDLEFLDMSCGSNSLKKQLIFTDTGGNYLTYYDLYATRDEIIARIAELNETLNQMKG